MDKANGIVTITNNSSPIFGSYLGKGMAYLIANSWSNYTSFPNPMTLKIDGSDNPQFLIFYVTFPPGRAPFVSSTTQWNYIFTGSSNPFQLFSLITTG